MADQVEEQGAARRAEQWGSEGIKSVTGLGFGRSSHSVHPKHSAVRGRHLVCVEVSTSTTTGMGFQPCELEGVASSSRPSFGR